MTPLSKALHRLAEQTATELTHENTTECSSPAEEFPRPRAKHDRKFVPLSVATELATWNAFSPPEPTPQHVAAKPEVEHSAELSLDDSADRAQIGRGEVRLYCDLSGSDQLAFLTAAQSNELVLEARFGSYRALAALPEASLTSCSERNEQVRWPGLMDGPYATKIAGVLRGRLDLRDATPAQRDWLLFLEDCRRAYRSVGLIVSATQATANDWLAARCDSVCLVTRAGETPATEIRQVAARLKSGTGNRPNCLVVRAA